MFFLKKLFYKMTTLIFHRNSHTTLYMYSNCYLLQEKKNIKKKTLIQRCTLKLNFKQTYPLIVSTDEQLYGLILSFTLTVMTVMIEALTPVYFQASLGIATVSLALKSWLHNLHVHSYISENQQFQKQSRGSPLYKFGEKWVKY